MRFLGLDVGTKTIGLAVCDEEEIVATPIKTLARNGGIRDLSAVATVYQEVDAQGLVLGLPLELAGTEGPAAIRIRTFGDKLQTHIKCPIFYWDERFSTVTVEKMLISGHVRRQDRKPLRDHLAATIILQTFIDFRKNQRYSDTSSESHCSDDLPSAPNGIPQSSTPIGDDP